jgi:hypothetical protein
MILETQKMKEKEDQDPKYWVTDFSRDLRRPFPLYASPKTTLGASSSSI